MTDERPEQPRELMSVLLTSSLLPFYARVSSPCMPPACRNPPPQRRPMMDERPEQPRVMTRVPSNDYLGPQGNAPVSLRPGGGPAMARAPSRDISPRSASLAESLRVSVACKA